MDNKKLNYFKNKLLEEKKETISTINYENENGADSLFQDYFNELSIYDNHPADIGTELYEAEMRSNLKSHEKRILNEIDNALKKLDKGTYGLCEKCGKEIDIERLEIIPSTRYCVNCKGDFLAVGDKIETRPVEEEVLKYPFSKSFNDEKDITGFDGEDSWQAVARFNKTNHEEMALDWYDNNMYDDNQSGIVEKVDDISNDYYKRQIKDVKEERE